LILGPWDHGRYNKDAGKVGELEFPEHSKFPVVEHQMKWFDRYLKGKSNGVDLDAPVRYYVMGACGEPDAPGHEWREARDWPPKSTETPYFLVSDGRVSTKEEPSGDESTKWTADPHDTPVLEGRQPQSGTDQREFESHSGVRTFSSDALTEPVEWTGMIRARLFISSSARDTDAIVRLTDVYPDGRSILLTDMVRRLRFRNGFEREEFLEPDKVHEVEFDVAWLSHTFNRGHRIRISVCSHAAPYWEVNPQTAEPITADLPAKMQVARNAVWHADGRRSAILAPVTS
jgi:putative CocE/NonD family hydrolase